MPNIDDRSTDKLATSILKLDETVANAYAHIQQLFTLYEKNIDQILERLRDKNFAQEGEDAGQNFTQQQYSDQKIYNQLLLDQNKAFSEFNIALQQIIEKLDPTSRATKMQDTTNFAHNNGMTVEEVSFYRKLGNYHHVDQQHADQNEQKLKKLYDQSKSNPEAFQKDPMIAALTKFDPELLKKLGNAKDLTEFIPMLIDAMARANRDKDINENAAKVYKEGEKFWDGNDALRALWTDLSIKYISQDEIDKLQGSKDQASERHQNKVVEAKTQAKSDGGNSSDLGNIAVANAGGQNAADTSLNAGMASLAQSIIDAINKITNKINDDPTFNGVEVAGEMGWKKGLEKIEKIAPVISDLADVLGVLTGGDGGKGIGISTNPADLVKAFGVALKYATAATEKFSAQLESQKYFDKQPLNKAMTMSGEKVHERLTEMAAQSDNPNNIKTMDYYGQEKGISFRQNGQTLDFQAYKDGKLIAPTVKSLDEITRSLQWLQDPKHKPQIAKMEKEHEGLKVDINLKTGEIGLVDKKGNIAANFGNTHSKFGGVQSFMAFQLKYALDKQLDAYYDMMREESDKQKKEAQQKKIAAENAKLRENMENTVSGHKLLFVPDTINPLPSIVKIDSPEAPQFSQKSPKNIEIASKITHHSNTKKNRSIPDKRQTAHDIKMAKDCSHIENSNNSYKYDVKITVNPPSGDPIKIAQQVCEQLKQHTCGNNIGYSKDAASRARTGQ